MRHKKAMGWHLLLTLIVGLALVIVLGAVLFNSGFDIWGMFKAKATPLESCKEDPGKYPVIDEKTNEMTECKVCKSTCAQFDSKMCAKSSKERICGLNCKWINNKCVAG